MSRAGSQTFHISEQLLFGIIALQNNFVTREKFGAAFETQRPANFARG
jgi:hypothetical protein